MDKQLGVEYLNNAELSEYISENKLSFPFCLEDIVFQIKQMVAQGVAPEEIFNLYAALPSSSFQLRVMINRTINEAVKPKPSRKEKFLNEVLAGVAKDLKKEGLL